MQKDQEKANTRTVHMCVHINGYKGDTASDNVLESKHKLEFD